LGELQAECTENWGAMRTRRLAQGRRLFVAVLFMALGVMGPVFVVPPAALAHAELVKAWPAAGASLARSPGEILLTFTEHVDVSLSSIQLYDRKGRLVRSLGTPTGAPGPAPAMRALLTSVLPGGLYTVEWRAISSDDGHASAGVYVFGVRAKPVSAQQRSLSGITPGQAAASIAGRWLQYVGLVLLVGAALTSWVALGGRVTEPGQWLLRGAWLVAAIGLFTSMLAERAITGSPSLLPMFLTPEGAALANEGKALVLCAAAVVVVFLWPHRVSLAIVSAVGAVTMLVHVFAGHADASASHRLLAVADQWVHMMGVGIWVGGLAWLVLGLRDEDQTQRADSIRGFSGIATVTLVPVLLTGLLRGIAEVASPSQLITTGYGITLLVKVALVLALVALGAVNHYRVVPALSADAATTGPFRLTSRGELILAACILGATAVLAGLAPAITAP
jgi:copper transport protein